MKNRFVPIVLIALAAAGALVWRGGPSAFELPGASHAPARPGEVVWLGDFESAQDVDQWEGRGASAEQDTEHATHGTYAAKIRFEKTEEPAFRLVKPLEKDRRLSDWRGYETLSFDIYNPSSSQQRVLLQLKDRRDTVYKEDIHLSGESMQHITVRLKGLAKLLDIGHVNEVTLFRWKPGGASTFYLDALRLQPSAGARADKPSGGITPAAQWQLLWATSLEKLPRDPAELPVMPKPPVTMSLARNEYESVQVVLIGGAAPVRVRVTVSPIEQVGGASRFPNDVLEIRMVGYVKTKEPYYPVAYVGKWPDPLPLASSVEVGDGTVQPVWLTIGAPESLPAGEYTGTITVTDEAGRAESLPLSVRVYDFAIARTPHLKTAFDFYPNRLKEAYQQFVDGGDAWEGKWSELKRRYYEDMLKHRISPVMSVDPTKESTPRDLQKYFRMGLTTFGIGVNGGSSGNHWPSGDKLQELMGWYRRGAHALHANGLLDRAYVYTYDEPKPGDPKVGRIMRAIHGAYPGLRNLLVMHKAPEPEDHAEWLRNVDILCIRMASYDPVNAEKFKALGKEMWLYVSSPAHPFPALVIDYPAIAHRILPWMCWKVQSNGLLYWCVDFWKGNPWKDPANFTPDQNGNGSLYYPAPDGPVPSIRMETLRDGMEDYEYLYMLRELAANAAAQGVDPALVREAEAAVAIDPEVVESLRNYTDDSTVLLAARDKMAQLIEQLQKALASLRVSELASP